MIYDALIIGAGPAGSTAARLLAQAGWSVCIAEKSSFPRRKVCGEFISATSHTLLHDPGIRDAFLGQAGPDVRRVGLFAGKTILNSPMPAATKSVAGWGRALGREHLDLILLDAAKRAGAQLLQPAKATGLCRAGGNHVCTVSTDHGSEELIARIIVVANGSWEASPISGDRQQQHRPSDLLAFKAHFTHGNLPPDLMPLLMFPGGYGGLVHSDAGRVSLSCCIRRDTLQACRKVYPDMRAGEAVFQHILASCEGVRDALQHAQLSGAWLSAGPIRPGIRRRYADGIFFIGNAAGEAHPVIAEGISMAIQSAWLLCRRLTERPENIAAAGRAYSADWKRAFALRIRAASLVAHIAMRPGIVGVVSAVVTQFPAILTWGARLSGKAVQLVGAEEALFQRQ